MKKVLIVALMAIGIAIGADRKVLGELYTSTTCPPCVAGNSLLTGILNSSGSYLGVIRYHVWWPGSGNDPFYNYNKSENGNRVNTYAVNSVPCLVVDGTKQSSSGTWQSAIDARHAIESPLAMKLYRSYEKKSAYNLEQGSGMVLIEITNETEAAQTFNLYGGLTENDVQYTGTNGDPTHQQVMIAMIPYVYGTKVDLAAGQTKSIAFDYKIDDTIPFLSTILEPTGETHIVDALKCELIFWCQNTSTKEVLQAANVAVPGSKQLLLENVSIADASGDGALSPNEEGYVHVKVSNGSSAKMTKVHVSFDVDNNKISVETGMYVIPEIPAKGSVTLSNKELVLKASSAYDGSACNIKCYAGSGSTDASMGFATKSFGAVEETVALNTPLNLPTIARRGSTITLSPMRGEGGNCSITIFDASGQLVGTIYQGKTSELSELVMPSVPAGLYFLKVEIGTASLTSKLVLLD